MRIYVRARLQFAGIEGKCSLRVMAMKSKMFDCMGGPPTTPALSQKKNQNVDPFCNDYAHRARFSDS